MLLYSNTLESLPPERKHALSLHSPRHSTSRSSQIPTTMFRAGIYYDVVITDWPCPPPQYGKQYEALQCTSPVPRGTNDLIPLLSQSQILTNLIGESSLCSKERLVHDASRNQPFPLLSCSRQRKALLVGINYFGLTGKLTGCVNDAKNMYSFLSQVYGYRPQDMVILTDDLQKPTSQPTKDNILRAMHWLVNNAKPNDSLLFHYSGNVALRTEDVSHR